MKTKLAVLLALVIAALPVAAAADVVTVTDLSYSVVAAGDGTRYVHVTLPTPQVPEKTVLGYAELRFDADLDPSMEIELWEDAGGETASWSLEDTEGLARTRWVMDKGGSPLVRFEITDLARDWAGAAKANHGVLVRLGPDQDTRDVALKQNPRFKLVYHILSADR